MYAPDVRFGMLLRISMAAASLFFGQNGRLTKDVPSLHFPRRTHESGIAPVFATKWRASPRPALAIREERYQTFVENKKGANAKRSAERQKKRETRRVKLATRAVGWVESEIRDWITARILIRDGFTEARRERGIHTGSRST
jgi:hypothetical protein